MIMLDMSAQIATLPRKKNAQSQPRRIVNRYVTLHYSGVAYQDRRPAAERARVLDEARYHLAKNWATVGKPPIFGSCYQYDFVVLSDGTVVRCQVTPHQLWHVGNATGNRESISVHVMLGGRQDLASAQRAALFALFDSLRTEHAIPRSHVVAHCEWPRGDGAPVIHPAYIRQPAQSECPGPVVFQHLAAYRALV